MKNNTETCVEALELLRDNFIQSGEDCAILIVDTEDKFGVFAAGKHIDLLFALIKAMDKNPAINFMMTEAPKIKQMVESGKTPKEVKDYLNDLAENSNL